MRLVLALACLAAVAGCRPLRPAAPAPPAPVVAPAPAVAAVPDTTRARRAVARLLAACGGDACGLELPRGTRLDTLVVDRAAARAEVRLTRDAVNTPWTPAGVARFSARVADSVAVALPGVAAAVTVAIHPARTVPLATLVTPFRRPGGASASDPLWPAPPDVPPLTRVVGTAPPAQGLAGRHLALWPSHGWYYEPRLDRWEWMRARVFTIVEDLLSVAFVTHELVPMLERAGAVVLMPRERDASPTEVVADADGSTAGARFVARGRWADGGAGFAHRPPYGPGVNPFRLGRHRASADARAEAVWTARLPEPADYAVHVAWGAVPGASMDARYTVHHAGGTTVVAANQTMAAGTWVYLGTFPFLADARVTLASGDGRPVSADAVRWGGGMGAVLRGGRTSGRPRFAEAARYYLQTAGAPDTTVYHVTRADDDYRDDQRARGEWVNWLRASPAGGDGFGPSAAPDAPGLGVPVDLTLAFHTDAGTTSDGSVIGTLVIYHSLGLDSVAVFPNGVARDLNRDLADRVQTQIVDDLRAAWDPAWRRRPMWDRDYSEATRPKVPTLLTEILSHHNAQDMRFALDPRFRADAARALYKGIGRFLAAQSGAAFVVQPLAPGGVAATFAPDGRVRVQWQPTPDRLEPSATADAFLVFARDGEGGWDAGTRATGTSVLLPPPPPGIVRSYRVAAVNAGGASAPSPVVAVGRSGRGDRPLLVVDGFDRVAPPAYVRATTADGRRLEGFSRADDPGMPRGLDVATVGDQMDLDAGHAWIDDDQPGWGTSDAAMEAQPTRGNTFDAAVPHGRSLLAAGRSFGSASAAAVASGAVPLAEAPLVALALGAQRRTPWPVGRRPPAFEALPPPLRARLTTYLGGGGKLILSGAFWATDTATDGVGASASLRAPTDSAVVWMRDVLGVAWRTDRAASDGRVEGTQTGPYAPFAPFDVRARPGLAGYAVPHPDGLVPADSTGATVLRYAQTSISAAVARRAPTAVVAFGFPLDAVVTDPERDALVARALRFLGE